MSPEKNQTSRLTLLFRYFVLTVMTLVLTAMVIASFWMVHQWVRYMDVHPGLWVYNIDNYGNLWSVFDIRERGHVVVSGVDSTSAAEKAGIQVGDSIIAVNGVRLKEKPQAFFVLFLEQVQGRKSNLS